MSGRSVGLLYHMGETKKRHGGNHPKKRTGVAGNGRKHTSTDPLSGLFPLFFSHYSPPPPSLPTSLSLFSNPHPTYIHTQRREHTQEKRREKRKGGAGRISMRRRTIAQLFSLW